MNAVLYNERRIAMDMKDDCKVYSSETLREELNEERKKKGLGEVSAINPKGGGTSTYARKDKSYSSVVDFFRKLTKRKV